MRRSFVAVVGLALLVGGASIAQAQDPQQQTPPATPAAPAQQAPAADSLKLTTDEAIIVFQVKPGKAEDFESGFKAMLDAMNASTNAAIKSMAGTMKLSKVALPIPADQPLMYVVQVSNSTKDLSYLFGKIIYYSGKEPGDKYDGIFPDQAAATAVYQKLTDSIAQQIPWPLQKIGG